MWGHFYDFFFPKTTNDCIPAAMRETVAFLCAKQGSARWLEGLNIRIFLFCDFGESRCQLIYYIMKLSLFCNIFEHQIWGPLKKSLMCGPDSETAVIALQLIRSHASRWSLTAEHKQSSDPAILTCRQRPGLLWCGHKDCDKETLEMSFAMEISTHRQIPSGVPKALPSGMEASF